MSNTMLQFKETITSLLFQDDVVIELPDDCELRNTDKIGKYKIVN